MTTHMFIKLELDRGTMDVGPYDVGQIPRVNDTFRYKDLDVDVRGVIRSVEWQLLDGKDRVLITVSSQ